MKNEINFILQQKDWVKIWDFHFSIWFLDRLIDIHTRFNNRLGYENKNTLHVFKNGMESAFFLEKEINGLKDSRKEKLLSREYMEKHYNGARLAVEKIQNFFLKQKNNLSAFKYFIEYCDLLCELLSYYRASRPEIFEIVEERLNNSNDKNEKEYLKELILKYGELRWELKNVWFDSEKKAESIKKEIASRLNISLEELEFFTNEEIFDFLSKNPTLNELKNIIEERKFCVFGLVQGKKVLITGSAAKRIADFITPEIKSVDTFTGKVAFPGKVSGFVRLIPQINYKEMIDKANEMKKGEILVTGMTQPDIIIACKKAAAIITDEGGITSHAAVISREIKIPCIIGTKIATKVLHDRDFVEVDAENGIVNILERAK